MTLVIGLGGHARMLAAIAFRVHGATPALHDYLLDPPGDGPLLNGVGNVAKIGDSDLARRAEIFERCQGRFRNIIDPSAVILGKCEGDAFPGVIVNTGTHVARDAILNTGALVEHDCIIGAHSHIAPGAVLCGEVRIGERTHVGARSVVKQGVHIGSGCVVGIGAVVRTNMPDGATLLADGRLILREQVRAPA